MSVGNRIKLIRLNKGMNKTEFGKVFGATGSLVNKWENTGVIPSEKRLLQIAKFGNITVDELLGKDTVIISKDEYNNLLEISEKYENIIKEDNS